MRRGGSTVGEGFWGLSLPPSFGQIFFSKCSKVYIQQDFFQKFFHSLATDSYF